MKKFLAILLSVMLVLAFSTVAFAAYTYTAVESGATFDANTTYYTSDGTTYTEYTGGAAGFDAAIGTGLYTRSVAPSITIIPNNTAGETESLAIDYTWYRILEADIDTDPAVAQATGATTTEGVVAYYVTTQARADELDDTGLFNITKVDGQNKWYVELADSTTTAQDLIDAFEDANFDLSVFPTGTFSKGVNDSSADSGALDAGYYYIQSSLGTKAAVQTLSPVTINEKNTYPTITKTDNKNYMAIDDTITYTVTVSIPESVDAKPITIYDTITNGLTLDTSTGGVTVSGAVADPAYTSATFVAYPANNVAATAAVEDDPTTLDVDESRPAVKAATGYKIEIPAETVIANKGRTLTFTYTAKMNEYAVVLEDEINKAYLTYDNYTTTEVEANVKTLAYDIQKVDGTDNTVILAGAEFELYDAQTGGDEIEFVLVEAASAANGNVNVYRKATTEEKAAQGFTAATITGGTARFEGLDATTYYLEETKAPTGYNLLTGRTALTVSESTSTATVDTLIENNKGSTLPSTGGIGTTILYIVGAILVLGAGILIIAKRRSAAAEQ